MLPAVLREKGHHDFAIQKAHVEQMLQLETTHNSVLEETNALLSDCRMT